MRFHLNLIGKAVFGRFLIVSMLLQVIGVFSPLSVFAAETYTPIAAANADQTHYRWRVDDAGENWAAAEDTALADHPVETNIRLRMLLDNTGIDPSFGTAASYDLFDTAGGTQVTPYISETAGGYVYLLESFIDSETNFHCRVKVFTEGGSLSSPTSVTDVTNFGGGGWCQSMTIDASNGYLFVGGTNQNNSYYTEAVRYSIGGGSLSYVDTKVFTGEYGGVDGMSAYSDALYVVAGAEFYRADYSSFTGAHVTKALSYSGESIKAYGSYVYVGTAYGYIYRFNRTGAMDAASSVRPYTTSSTSSYVYSMSLDADGNLIYGNKYSGTYKFGKVILSTFTLSTSITRTTKNYTAYVEYGQADGVAIDTVNNLLFVGGHAQSDYLDVIDLGTMTLKGTLAQGEYTSYGAMSFDASSGNLYVAMYDDISGYDRTFATLNRITTVPGSIDPQLQYGEKGISCSDVSAWTNVPTVATSEVWEYADSTHVVDGGLTSNISGGLTDPSGSFSAGKVIESTSSHDIALDGDVFTEVEFTLASTVYAVGSYCFRAVDADGAVTMTSISGPAEISTTGGHEIFQLEASSSHTDSKIDSSGTYIYMLGYGAGSSYPNIVQKVRASDLEHVTTFSVAGHYVYGFDIDSTGTYGYFLVSAYDEWGSPTQEKILKVQLSNMSIVDSDNVTFAIEASYSVNVFLGPSGSHLYVIGISNYDSVIAKYNISTSVSSVYNLSTDLGLSDFFLSAAVSGSGYAFTGTDDGNVMKFNLNDGSDVSPAFLLSYNVSNALDTDWDDHVYVSVNSTDSYVYAAGYDETEAAGYAVKLNLADLTEVAGTYATSATLIGIFDGAIDVSATHGDDYVYYVATTAPVDYPNATNSIFRVNFTTAPLSIGLVQTLSSGVYSWHPTTIVVDQTDAYYGIYDADTVEPPNDDLYAVSLATFSMTKSPISFTEGTYDPAPPAPSASYPTTINVVRLGRLKAGTATTAGVSFVLSRELSGTLTVTFPEEFTLNEASTPTKSACLSVPVINNTTHTVTATKTSCSGSVFISGIGITTPSTPGNYIISWINDDPGQSIVTILSEDQVNVTANVDPFLTFDVDTNTDCSLAAGGGDNDISLGVLASGVVSTGSEHVCLSLDTNAAGGAIVEYKAANKGLSSAAAGYVIGNAQTEGAQVDLDGQSLDGMGLCVSATSVVTTTPAGSIVSVAPYNGTCGNHVVGSINTSFDEIFNTALDAVDGNGYRSVDILVKAMSVGTTPAASDYTNTLTFRATGTF